MDSLNEVLKLIDEKVVEYKLLSQSYAQNKIGIAREKNFLETLEKTKAIINDIGENIQRRIKAYIEETVTMALQSVLGDDYRFVIEFQHDKRDQLEVLFFINHFGENFEPRKNTCEGGAIDICSFALRMICLTLEEPKVDYILFLDEPFKNVSKKYMGAVCQMVVDISSLMDLQVIMVTHVDDLIETADNIVYL
jgi:DNA repair exonuclease SbcCD ATPase subunit